MSFDNIHFPLKPSQAFSRSEPMPCAPDALRASRMDVSAVISTLGTDISVIFAPPVTASDRIRNVSILGHPDNCNFVILENPSIVKPLSGYTMLGRFTNESSVIVAGRCNSDIGEDSAGVNVRKRLPSANTERNRGQPLALSVSTFVFLMSISSRKGIMPRLSADNISSVYVGA